MVQWATCDQFQTLREPILPNNPWHWAYLEGYGLRGIRLYKYHSVAVVRSQSCLRLFLTIHSTLLPLSTLGCYALIWTLYHWHLVFTGLLLTLSISGPCKAWTLWANLPLSQCEQDHISRDTLYWKNALYISLGPENHYCMMKSIWRCFIICQIQIWFSCLYQ